MKERSRDSRITRAVLWISVLILIAHTLSSFIPVHGEEELYRNVIRLHVIANSDSDEDQKTKLLVRDAVLDTVGNITENARDFKDAYELLSSAIPQITDAAKECLSSLGSDDSVNIEFGRESYPVRFYESYALPAGEYMSMRIVIGEGSGHNWWCVLFPPMCRDSAIDAVADEEKFFAAGFTPEEYRIIKKDSSPKYRVRFKILELLAETFGFDY